MEWNTALSPRRHREAVEVLCVVVELLEVRRARGWEQGGTPTVSPTQLRALYVIDHHEGTNLRDLGDALGITPSSVSRLCDRLQDMRFVRRSTSEVNRREVELRLTPRGVRYLSEMRTGWLRRLRGVLAELPADTRRALLVEAGRLCGPRPFVAAGEGPPPEVEVRLPPTGPAVRRDAG
ncbi:MarR family transcriptional regulator [Streptomyces sp. NPDC005438]|uniref:MarR family winged helix-turn-helix transcriptional regulator n=1 Tax=Streptomyces sp. NPDC005438 TaxID=3156880 RepID=UPI0033ADF14F